MKRAECLFVSVVIPTYSREGELCNTVEGFLGQDYPAYEIIVVDQSEGHLAKTEQFLEQHAQDIRLVRVPKPSLPRARNIGAEAAAGEIVLYVDDDVVPDPDLITQHAVAYSDPQTGGIAGRRTLLDRQEALEPVGLIDDWGTHVRNFSSTVATPVQWASGCHMSFRRELIFKAGLFEPAFIGTAVYEDVDFCFRLRRLGYEIQFQPRAHLVHLQAGAGGCRTRQRDVRWHYSMIHNSLLFLLRHYPIETLPRLFLGRLTKAVAVARHMRDPMVSMPLVGASFRALRSHAVARHSLPEGLGPRSSLLYGGAALK